MGRIDDLIDSLPDALVSPVRSNLDSLIDSLPDAPSAPITRPPVASPVAALPSSLMAVAPAPQPRATLSLTAPQGRPTDVPSIAGQGPPSIPVQPRKRMFPEVTPAPKPPVGVPTLASAQPSSTAVVPAAKPTPPTPVEVPDIPGVPAQYQAIAKRIILGVIGPGIPISEHLLNVTVQRPEVQGMIQKAIAGGAELAGQIPAVVAADVIAAPVAGAAQAIGAGRLLTAAARGATALGATGALPRSGEEYTPENVVLNVGRESLAGGAFGVAGALPEVLAYRVATNALNLDQLAALGVKTETIDKVARLAGAYLSSQPAVVAGAAGLSAVVGGGIAAVGGGSTEDVVISAGLAGLLPLVRLLKTMPTEYWQDQKNAAKRQMAQDIVDAARKADAGELKAIANRPDVQAAAGEAANIVPPGPGTPPGLPIAPETPPGTSPTGRTTVEPARGGRSSLAVLEDARAAIQEANRLDQIRAQEYQDIGEGRNLRDIAIKRGIPVESLVRMSDAEVKDALLYQKGPPEPASMFEALIQEGGIDPTTFGRWQSDIQGWKPSLTEQGVFRDKGEAAQTAARRLGTDMNGLLWLLKTHVRPTGPPAARATLVPASGPTTPTSAPPAGVKELESKFTPDELLEIKMYYNGDVKDALLDEGRSADTITYTLKDKLSKLRDEIFPRPKIEQIDVGHPILRGIAERLGAILPDGSIRWKTPEQRDASQWLNAVNVGLSRRLSLEDAINNARSVVDQNGVPTFPWKEDLADQALEIAGAKPWNPAPPTPAGTSGPPAAPAGPAARVEAANVRTAEANAREAEAKATGAEAAETQLKNKTVF